MEKFSITLEVKGKKFTVVSDGTEEGTHFEGDERADSLARVVCDLELHVQFGDKYGPALETGYSDPLAVAAAMFFAVGHHGAVLIEGPDSVTEFFASLADETTGEITMYMGEE